MSDVDHGDQLDDLLAAAAPTAPQLSGHAVDVIWARVEPAMAGRKRRRRGRVPGVVGGLIAAGAIAASGVAGAQIYSAHTHQGPIDAEDRRLGGPGERLDPGADDYLDVITAATADIPFPTAAARDAALGNQVEDEHGVKPGQERVSTGAVRAWVADAAVCAWSNQWAAATRDGDQAARDQAIAAVHQAPHWPAVLAIDPSPYSRPTTMHVTGPNGQTHTESYQDESQFYYYGPLGQALDGTNLDAVADLLARNNGYCQANLVPDLPQANALNNPRLQ